LNTVKNKLLAKEVTPISYDSFKGFEKKWHQVAVRFRKDTSEMRVIYANKIAQKAIENHMTKFPDGSVLAKIAYLAEPDPLFESSLRQSQLRRYQFMIKDSTKYLDGKGWGYALYDSEGKPTTTNLKEQTEACISCHDIAENRDYVFSVNLSLRKDKQEVFEWRHKSIALKQIPESIRSLIPSQFKFATLVQNPKLKHVFEGTFDEVKPSLSKLAVKLKNPILFASQDFKKFALVFPENLSIHCDDEGAKGLFIASFHSTGSGGIHKNYFCQSF
jgi:hypothetical protein